MSKVLASHQPDFFPYMGYFYKMFKSDIFVFSDNVQFSKSERHNFNHILTQNGAHKFKLPVHYHCVNINEIKIAATEYTVDKMLKTLWSEYKQCDAFEEAYPVVYRLMQLAPTEDNLATFNEKCLLEFADRFGLKKDREFLISSELPLTQKRDSRIIEMCKLLGADTYYSGVGAKDYHIEQDYADNGITLIYSDYQPVVYKQAGRNKTLNMSVLDYVFNCGFNIPEGWTR